MIKKVPFLHKTAYLLLLMFCLQVFAGCAAEVVTESKEEKSEAINVVLNENEAQGNIAPDGNGQQKNVETDGNGQQKNVETDRNGQQRYVASEAKAAQNDLVVHIVCEKQSGSGVIYGAADGQAIIVTAAHVVEDAESAAVSLAVDENSKENEPDVTEIIRIDGLDLAFLRVGGVAVEWGAREHLPEQPGSVSEQLTILGYDQTGESLEVSGTMSEGWIFLEDFQSHMMLGMAEAAPGMSGGPVLSENGIFLGILCGIDASGQVAILPASVIEAEYGIIMKDSVKTN